jgi:glycosyltransferase involved in cell wall biosynthesis
MLRSRLHKVDVLFCQTEAMLRRAVETYDFTGRTALAPNAVSEFLMPPATDCPARLRGRRESLKLLALAKYYPHKNLEIIFESYRRYRHELRDTMCVLTIHPNQHPRANKMLEAVQQEGLANQIVNVGPVSHERLTDYFIHTDAMILPTLLESFSGSYLEAMHFGRPILTSDLDFAHGVCGEAAEYFNPWDSGSVRDAIIRLRDDPDLRERLVRAGVSRRTQFTKSWKVIAAEMLAVLHATNG